MRRARDSARARRCIAGGAETSPDRMLRFVQDPDGRLAVDLGCELPGRGAWVTSSREAVTEALAKHCFERAFKKPAALPEEMSETAFVVGIEAGLEARALAALGLARRAGAVVLGFDQVRAALREGKALVLVTASDAGDDGAEKLARLAGKPPGAPIIRAFSVEAQSAALGRDGVTHAALTLGAPRRFFSEARRLSGFRPVFADQSIADQREPEKRGLETAGV